jgi:hypothetical protein
MRRTADRDAERVLAACVVASPGRERQAGLLEPSAAASRRALT